MEPTPLEPTLEEVLARLIERFEEDSHFDATPVLDRYPQYREELDARLTTLRTAGLISQPESKELTGLAVLERLERSPGRYSEYRIRERVARGGMGEILSIRDEMLHRDLAMKVILDQDSSSPTSRLPNSSSRRLVRFLEEAQVTGQLEHPGIVPIHELGLTPEGRAYFTMKLVKGRTLAEIFEQTKHGDPQWTRTRALTLIQRVCEAMAYAHERGVIHRDLKPSNVMVGDFGEVYVMDWGLARILARPEEKDIRLKPAVSNELATDRSRGRAETPGSPLYTMDGDAVGTPAYMAPEQAAGRLEEVGPHSDVYAIGAMLYHLLAGRPPYADDTGLPEPRVVLARVLSGPPGAVHALALNAPAELIAICEKAMARETAARYRGISDLANDLRAFLENRVVRAHRTGAVAELSKWMRRNRALAAAGACALLFLLGGSAGISVVQAAGKRAAENERILADEVRDFMVRLFAANDPRGMGSVTLTAKELLDRGRTNIEATLERAPLTRAMLLFAMGRAYVGLGDTSSAETLLEESLSLLRQEDSEERHTAEVLNQLGQAESTLGKYEEAELHLLEAVQLFRHLGGDQSPCLISLINLGDAYRMHGKLEEAEDCYNAAESGLRRDGAMETDIAAGLLNNRAIVRRVRGDLGGAEADYRQVLAIMDRIPTPPAFRFVTMTNLALTLWEARRVDEARTWVERAIEGQKGTLSPDHPNLLASMGTLGVIAQTEDHFDEAEKLYRDVLERRTRSIGPAARGTLQIEQCLADLLVETGRLAEGETVLEQALEGQASAPGPDDRDRLVSLVTKSVLRQKQGRKQEALRLGAEALHGFERIGPSPSRVVSLLLRLAELSRDLGQVEDAGKYARRVLQIAPEGFTERPQAQEILTQLGLVETK